MLRRDPDADKDLVKSMWPKQRQLWLVYDLDDTERKVQLMDYSYHQFGKQLKAELDNADEEDGFDYFADLEDGMTLRINFEENKPYGFEASSINFKKRKLQYREDLVDELPCLDDLIKVETYDALKAVFFQTEDEDEEDVQDDEDEKDDDLHKWAGKAGRKDAEEEVGDDVEDEEEDEKPKAKPKIKPKVAKPARKEPEPEEDEDEWDEDWEEDEKPKPKTKSKAVKATRKEPEPEEDDDDWE